MQKEDPIREVQPSLQGCNAVDTHDPQVDVPACAVPSYGSFSPSTGCGLQYFGWRWFGLLCRLACGQGF